VRVYRRTPFRSRALGLALLAVATGVCPIGCKKSTPTANLPIVDINPIVVLASGEVPGAATNKGCRLTLRQITDHLEHLNKFTESNWQFSIRYPKQAGSNGLVIPLEFEDALILQMAAHPPGGPRNFPFSSWIGLAPQGIPGSGGAGSIQVAQQLGLWDANKINIFFTGNVQVNTSNPDDTRANTVDPSDEQPPVIRHIFINDLGFEIGTPRTELTWNVLPHELCHYLIRQKSTQNGRYNLFEHAVGVNQLMRSVTPHPKSVAQQDSAEIKTRVQQNLVNNQ